jgi:hypothetical protein
MTERSLAEAAPWPVVRPGFLLCASVLVMAAFFQKIALPGTNGIYPLSLIIFPAVSRLY